MLSKDIEQIKYKDSHGREVIPYWRLQDLIKEAKKEVFDDIDKVLKEFSSFTTYDYINDYRIKELKKKHLVKKH